MKNKLESKEKIGILQVLKKILIDNPESANTIPELDQIGILQVLKKILIDNPESANTIPELDQIEPTNEEEKRLLEELKKETAEREKRLDFMERYGVTNLNSYKLKENQNIKKRKKEDRKEKEETTRDSR